MASLIFESAHKLAQLIQTRQLSSLALTEAYLQRIATYNPQLNAICTLDEPGARARAKAADEALSRGEYWGPLHGVPITIKDIFETQGLRTTAGHRPLKNYVPQQDATVVARLRAAGAVILGKTNPAELASDWQGINGLFPRVNNPWDLDVTPGGSTSGGAAAIAASLSAITIGDDFGGSLRQPAHFCGIYSLKPTDRRLPTTGHIPELPGRAKCIRQMLTVGPMARSVADLRLALEVMVGPDSRQPDIPPVPLDQPGDRPLNQLRIAWSEEFPGFPVAAEIKAGLAAAVAKITDAGATVESWLAPLDYGEVWRLGFQVAVYNSIFAQDSNGGYLNFMKRRLAFMKRRLAFMWREATQGEAVLRRQGNVAKMTLPLFARPRLQQYFELLTQRDRVIAQLDSALEPWDVWLCPVAMTVAFPHCPPGQAIEVDGRSVPYMMASGAYTNVFALSGHPVVVIPMGQTANGLPMGMQVVGQRWREMELLRVAEAIASILGPLLHPPGCGNSPVG